MVEGFGVHLGPRRMFRFAEAIATLVRRSSRELNRGIEVAISRISFASPLSVLVSEAPFQVHVCLINVPFARSNIPGPIHDILSCGIGASPFTRTFCSTGNALSLIRPESSTPPPAPINQRRVEAEPFR